MPNATYYNIIMDTHTHIERERERERERRERDLPPPCPPVSPSPDARALSLYICYLPALECRRGQPLQGYAHARLHHSAISKVRQNLDPHLLYW